MPRPLGTTLALGVLISLVACLRIIPRDEWQRPAAVVAALELRGGERVADLGAGDGYFTFKLAEAVGADGIVYALDVDADAVAVVAEQARAAGVRNVHALSVPSDVMTLPEKVT